MLYMYGYQQPLESDMQMTKSQLFAHVHAIVRHKNVAYFGGYQAAFGHFLREAYAQKLVRSWAV